MSEEIKNEEKITPESPLENTKNETFKPEEINETHKDSQVTIQTSTNLQSDNASENKAPDKTGDESPKDTIGSTGTTVSPSKPPDKNIAEQPKRRVYQKNQPTARGRTAPKDKINRPPNQKYKQSTPYKDSDSRFRRKACRFCQNKRFEINYKDAVLLGRYITDRGKILPRRITGTCARHQRALSRAIKQARILAIVPFVVK